MRITAFIESLKNLVPREEACCICFPKQGGSLYSGVLEQKEHLLWLVNLGLKFVSAWYGHAVLQTVFLVGSSGLLDILGQMSFLLGRQTSIGANTSSWFCLFRFPHIRQGREQWGEEGAGKEGTYTHLEGVPGSGPGALQKLPSLILQATIETASLISRFCRNLMLWELNCRKSHC